MVQNTSGLAIGFCRHQIEDIGAREAGLK